MLAEKRWEQQWFHFYKWIACMGIIAVIIPVFELILSCLIGQYSGIVSVLVVPLLVAIGYIVQYTCLGKAKYEIHATTLDFSFENQKIKLSWKPVILAFAIVSILAGGVGHLLERLLFGLLEIEIDRYLEFPVFIILCIFMAIIGCCLVPFRFHQLLSIRTFVECIFVFTLVYGFQFYLGDGMTFVLYFSLLIFTFCLFISLNQAYVIKPSTISKSSYATNELRFVGIKSVLLFWLAAVVLQIPFLGGLSLLITPFLLFLNGYDLERSFVFPFVDFPMFNAVFFGISLVFFGIAMIFLLIHFRNGEIRYWLYKFSNWIQKLWERFLRWIASFQNKIEIYVPKLFEQPKHMHYVDTVTQISAVVSFETEFSFRLVQKKIKTFVTINERYCYAYRVLLANLYESKIGIEPHQTLLEMVSIVNEKTILKNFNELTNIFLEIIYAENKDVTKSDLDTLLEILKIRLKK